MLSGIYYGIFLPSSSLPVCCSSAFSSQLFSFSLQLFLCVIQVVLFVTALPFRCNSSFPFVTAFLFSYNYSLPLEFLYSDNLRHRLASLSVAMSELFLTYIVLFLKYIKLFLKYLKLFLKHTAKTAKSMS